MYFNYHAKVKNLIMTGHCIGFDFVESYHNIKPCLLLYFDNSMPLPIRKHKFDEYKILLAKCGIEQK